MFAAQAGVPLMVNPNHNQAAPSLPTPSTSRNPFSTVLRPSVTRGMISPLISNRNTTSVTINLRQRLDNSLSLLQNVRSVGEITTADPLFFLDQNGKLSCRCCPSGAGFNVPANVYNNAARNNRPRTLTVEWRNLKKGLRKHVLLQSHQVNSRHYFQRQGLIPSFDKADTVAGLNLIRMVYENIKSQRSYNSFPQSVAARHLEDTNIGFQNHSAAFPPKIVDCFYDIIKASFTRYLSTPTPFGTPLPFGISCDKDTSKSRSRQLSGIRFPCFDDKLTLPFVNTVYMGHPACEAFDGQYLASKIASQVQDFGIIPVQSMEAFAGSCYDGQYMHLKATEHLEREFGMGQDVTPLEIWDGAHLVELIYKNALNKCPAISTVVTVVNRVTVILKNTVYEKYLSTCQSLNLPFRQPKTPKSLKFVTHGLDQLEDCRAMKAAIVSTLSSHGQSNGAVAAKCKSYVTQMTQPSFDLILSFVIDLLRILSSFSLKFQNKLLFIHEYYNLCTMLKEMLSNIRIYSNVLSISIDQKFVFQTFCDAVSNARPSAISGPQYLLRSSVGNVTFRTAVITAVRRCKRFVSLLEAKSTEYMFDNSEWKQKTKTVLPDCAYLLNFLSDGIETVDRSFITGGKEMCVDCERFLNAKAQRTHSTDSPTCTSAIWITVPSLLPSFTPIKTVNTVILQNLIPTHIKHHISASNIQQLKLRLDLAKVEISRKKLKPSLDNCAKVMFTNRRFWGSCQKGALYLLLKVLTIPCSEAFMESLGSIMERYHKRFTANDANFDDLRMQKEMFIYLNGPPLIDCSSYMKATLQKYRQLGQRTFAHENTFLSRLSASSLTIKRLQNEAVCNRNSIGCLEF